MEMPLGVLKPVIKEALRAIPVVALYSPMVPSPLFAIVGARGEKGGGFCRCESDPTCL